MITEADTCRKYVLKKLYSASWTDEQINEQKTITKTKLVALIPSILKFKGKL